jgi:putative aldouronate transport system permease protein
MCFSLFSIDGMVNNVIVKLGGDPVSFLTKPQYFRTMIVATSMWKESGWGSIIYLAAIAGIDPEQYEAAIIDGANRFRRIIHITIPGITKALFTVCILMLSNILNAGFDQVFNFYNEAVYSTGDIIDTFVYRLGMTSGRYELATAVGLFKSAIGFIAIIGANTASKKIIGVGLY